LEKAGNDPPHQKGEIQESVGDIIETIPLRDLVSFADMEESDVRVIQLVLELYIRRKLGADGIEDEFPEIMEALRQRVRETHRLRRVK